MVNSYKVLSKFVFLALLFVSLVVFTVKVTDFEGMSGVDSTPERYLFWTLILYIAFLNGYTSALAKTPLGFLTIVGWTLGAVVLFYLFILGGLPQENCGGYIAKVAVITLLVPIETFGRAVLDAFGRKRSRKK